jgi:hypothetical protein
LSPSFIVVLAALGAAPATVAAQSEHDVAAYFAMIASPIGTLPPILSNAMLGRPMTSPDIAVRYGHLPIGDAAANTFDARIGFPAGTKVMMGVNAGYESYSSCGGCDGHFIGGVNAEGRLASSMLGTGSDAALLNIGLNGEAGFGHESGSTAFSLNAGLPVALVSGTGTLRIAPFLTPGFGWGRISGGGDSVNGTRFLLGGGITFQSLTNNLGVNLGFQKVFIDGGDTMFGVSLIFGTK